MKRTAAPGPESGPAVWSGPWPAPAKLNLMLRILGQRADGYHLLQTVFQFLERADRLHFRPRADGQVRRVSGPEEVPEDQDLTVRAALLLKACTGCAGGVDIRVEKRLPMGGGLGGGSSDAATTLVALDRIWGTALGRDALARIGLELGADVPVFVAGKAAWGEGVGERLRPLQLPEPWYLVLIPPCRVATGEVFSAPDLVRDSPPVDYADFFAGERGNDCTPLVRRRYPAVAHAMDWLDQEEDTTAYLTGTGSCVFAAFADEAAAVRLWQRASTRFEAFVARGLNRSPLRAAADAYRHDQSGNPLQIR